MEALFDRLGLAWTVALTVVLLVAIGYVDYVTGTEVRAYPLYILPVSLSSWRLGRVAGLLTAVASALTWDISNTAAGLFYSRSHYEYINLVSVFCAFAVVSLLISTQRRLLVQERVLSRSDALTGVANRRAFLEALELEVARAGRYRHPLTVALADLDDFKDINDRLGHRTGDLVLQEVAKAMRGATRATNVVARYGGDEFALLLVEADVSAGRVALENIRLRVAEAMGSRGWGVTCSIGAVTCLGTCGSVEGLLREADGLLYAAKETGKNALRHELAQGQGSPAPA